MAAVGSGLEPVFPLEIEGIPPGSCSQEVGEEWVCKRKSVTIAIKRGVNARQVGDIQTTCVHTRNLPY